MEEEARAELQGKQRQPATPEAARGATTAHGECEQQQRGRLDPQAAWLAERRVAWMEGVERTCCGGTRARTAEEVRARKEKRKEEIFLLEFAT